MSIIGVMFNKWAKLVMDVVAHGMISLADGSLHNCMAACLCSSLLDTNAHSRLRLLLESSTIGVHPFMLSHNFGKDSDI